MAKNVSQASNELTVVISSPLVSAGGTYSAIKSDGTVWVWGKNYSGQTGDGTTITKAAPSQASTLNGFISISSGVDHSVGLKSDGTVWAWGDNLNGGNLANDTITQSSVPVQITQLNSIIAIDVGLAQSFALKNDGTVWAWGNNQYGQLGDGTKNKAYYPVKVANIDSVVAISNTYSHTLALKGDGSVWAWGYNERGELGDGTTVERLIPTQVVGLDSVISVSAGTSHSMALKRDGTVWQWGWNLTNEGTTGQITPAKVPNLTDVVSISDTSSRSVALKKDGTVWTWGVNTKGNLGDGTTLNRVLPVQVSHLNSIVGISANDTVVLATMNNGSVWSFGSNGTFGLGNGGQTSDSTSTRIQVTGIPGNYSDNVPPSAPTLSATGIASNSVVLTWSESLDNFVVQSYDIYNGSTLVGSQSVDSKSSLDARTYTVTGLSPSTTYSFSVRAKDGSGNTSVPSNVITVTTKVALPLTTTGGIYESIVLKSDGTVWKWGSSDTAPVQLPNLNSIVQISESYSHLLALKSDGTVWGWGQNRSGQLGDGTGTARTVPIQIPNMNNVVAVSAGGSHSLVLKSDGTVWAFGSNYYGQIGNGESRKDQYTPVQVPNLTSVKAISAASYHSMALQNDGTVWTWGANFYGELGDGTIVDNPLPRKVNSLSNVSTIESRYDHNMAIKNDGTVWAWGSNTKGQLGDGTKVNRILPVQLNIDSVRALSTGTYHTVALKNDGTIMSWGYNYYGAVGDGTRVDKLVPTKIENFSGVTSVSSGSDYSTSVNTGGSVWAWGNNSHNVFGNPRLQTSLTPLRLSFFDTGVATSSKSLVEKEVPIISEKLDDENEPVKSPLEPSYADLISVDKMPPTSPDNFAISSQNGSNIIVSWSPSEDNFEVIGYNVYSDNEIIGNTKNETTIQLYLKEGNHLLTVKAYDEAGNESLASSAIWVSIK